MDIVLSRVCQFGWNWTLTLYIAMYSLCFDHRLLTYTVCYFIFSSQQNDKQKFNVNEHMKTKQKIESE